MTEWLQIVYRFKSGGIDEDLDAALIEVVEQYGWHLAHKRGRLDADNYLVFEREEVAGAD